MANAEYDFLMKLLMLGDRGVGKSSLVYQFVDGIFLGAALATIGVDFKIRTIEVDERILKLQIWDTASAERMRKVPMSYVRNVQGILFVYDVSNLESFNGLQEWLDEIDRLGSGNVCKLIVGNKSDLEARRVVTYEQGKEFADLRGLDYVETSARSGEHVDMAFRRLSTQIKAKIRIPPPSNKSITLTNDSTSDNSNDAMSNNYLSSC